MKKNKYPDNVLANIRWFAEHRHDFSFSGSERFNLDKVEFWRYPLSNPDDLTLVNIISWASFCAAYDHNPKANYLPKYTPGKEAIYGFKLVDTSEECIVHDVNGVDAIDAFVHIDSYGAAKPTRHSALLRVLLKTKASLNLFIQMYAEDRANGRLPKELFQSEIVEPFKFLPWMIEAVEQQKWNYNQN